MLRKIVHFMMYCVIYLSATSITSAESVKTYSVIVPFTAGGASDIMFRFIEPELNKRLEKHKINLILENSPGAGGSIGLFKIINNNKLTFGFFSPFFAINKNIKDVYTYDYDYDSVKFLSFAGYNKMIVLSGAYTNMNQLRDACVKNKRVSFGSSGVGSTSHLASYLYAKKYLKCVEVLSVPYKGTSMVYPDLKAGRIDFMADFAINVDSFIESKYLNSIEEIKETDFASWHVFVANTIENKDAEIVKIEFESLKRDKQFIDKLETRFNVYKFSETKDINWLKNEFVNYKRIIESLPKTN
jgi:tripartite-type tricarboxylate transporter receptor subunit TctC